MTKARDIANAGTALATVDPTELGYLNGVTSAVQTQMDAKLPTATASSTYLPTATASSTYLPTATAASTYLTVATAATTYQGKVTASTSAPSGGSDGDVWIQYV